MRGLRSQNISTKSDDSGVQIGKKYARFDELGIPFVVTVDYDSLNDRKVTLRDRDSMAQKRVDMSTLADIVAKLLKHEISFDQV